MIEIDPKLLMCVSKKWGGVFCNIRFLLMPNKQWQIERFMGSGWDVVASSLEFVSPNEALQELQKPSIEEQAKSLLEDYWRRNMICLSTEDWAENVCEFLQRITNERKEQVNDSN